MFEEERVYYEYDGDKVKVSDNEWKITRQLKNLTSNVIHPIFGFDKEREFAFSQELAKKGLSKKQQKQILICRTTATSCSWLKSSHSGIIRIYS